ncbi:tetratricopeptide repeat protein [bacterium]|nr:tetratricopeptide repeat protein [bacterium]
MKKSVLAILLVAGVIVLGSMGAGVWLLVKYMPRSVSMRHASKPIHVQVPKQKSTDTLAVFNFSGEGDSDAMLYSIGFARALADRLHCAPTCLTQQPSISQISARLCQDLGDSFAVPSIEQAAKIGRSMGVRYAVTGQLKMSGNNVDIVMWACDTYKPSSKSEIKLSGVISDIGNMQLQAVDKLLSVMKLKPTKQQFAELRKPNFTNPQILKVYANSFKEPDMKKKEAMRWQMVGMDPGSSFAVIRLLEYYYYSPSTAPQIKSNTRLQKLLSGLEVKFPANSATRMLQAMLFVSQYDYERAEKELTWLAKSDPKMAGVHSMLAYVARCRQNGKMAVAEGKKAVSLWSDNTYLRASLANDYSAAASCARQGHYMRNMNKQMYSDWLDNSNKCLREAMIAAKVDPNCSLAWYQMMQVSLELGNYDQRDKAYKKLLEISPKDTSTYIEYGRGYLRQWGGSRDQLDKIFMTADKAFGAGSSDACLVRASLLMCQANKPDDQPEILNLAERGIKASKEPNYGCLLKKCQSLAAMKRRDEAYKIAQEGYRRWGSLDWLFQLARLNGALYYYEHKMDNLRQARAQYAEYVRQIPNNPEGHVQLGWCLSHLGNRDEAKKQFLRALELDPTNESAKEKMKYVQ